MVLVPGHAAGSHIRELCVRDTFAPLGDCVGNADEKIKAACTAIIEQKGRSPQELARALVWRGVWYRNQGQSEEAYADFRPSGDFGPSTFSGSDRSGAHAPGAVQTGCGVCRFHQRDRHRAKGFHTVILLRGDILVHMGQANRSLRNMIGQSMTTVRPWNWSQTTHRLSG